MASRETVIAAITACAVILLSAITILVPAWYPRGPEVIFDPGFAQAESQDSADPGDSGPAEELSSEELAALQTPSSDLWTRGVASSVRLQVGMDGVATGVFLGKDEEQRIYVLTVYHAAREVIRQVDFFSIKQHSGPIASSRLVEVIANSPRCDLAILRVTVNDRDAQDLKPGLPLCRELPEKEPKYAFSLGCDGRVPLPTSELIIDELKVQLPNQVRSTLMWKTKNSQPEGRSGGPLVDSDGRILGIALGKRRSGGGYYCHHKELVNYLVDNGLDWLLNCGT